MSSHFAEVNGWTIWYERYGSGPSPLLLIPGSIGTAKTDFLKQLEGVNAFDHDQFTMIAVEAPGWGRSRPPARPYGPDVYDNDSECFYQLMTGLGYKRFSVIAWSDGANACIWLGCKYPDAIIKMALHGVAIHSNPKSLSALESIRDVDLWDERRLTQYMRAYGCKETIQWLWDRFIRFTSRSVLYKQSMLSSLADKYGDRIDYPVLVIHGDKDALSSIENPEYILKSFPRAQLYRFPNGNHDLHQQFSASYRKVVQNFLLNDCKQ